MNQYPYQAPPAYGQLDTLGPAFSGARAAGPGIRFASACIDGALITIPMLIVQVLVSAGTSSTSTDLYGYTTTVDNGRNGTIASLVLWAVYWLLIWSWYGSSGWTPGKRMLGLRLVDAASGKLPGYEKTLIRGVCMFFGGLFCSIGAIIGGVQILTDYATRRAFWDTAAGTILIDTKHGVDTTMADSRVATSAAAATPPVFAYAQLAAQAGAPSVAPPAPAPSRDDCDDDLERTRIANPAAPVVPTSFPTVSQAADSFQRGSSLTPRSFDLWFDDGAQVHLFAPSGLIGTNPRLRTGEEPAQVVRVRDTTRSFADTHLQFTCAGTTLQLIDMGTIYGTVLVNANGERQQMTAWTPYPVSETDTIVVGRRYFRILSRM